MWILWVVLIGLLLFFLLVLLFGYFLSGPVYKGPKTDHFDGKKFINPNKLAAQNIGGVFKYLTKREPEVWKSNYETFIREERIEERNTEGKVHIIFVNHSTFLIQYGGLNILTDPVWSRRCSPFQFAGPPRMRPPGIRFEDLPPIDLVLLSHNHYDHLDKNTVKRLLDKHDPQFIVPLGVGALLNKWGITKTQELDWWQDVEIGRLKITATPANHFTSRGIFDRDRTLWCGFLMQLNEHKLYYVGDTGYGDNFKTVGERVGEIDLCFIPIGAYKPEWFMGPIHISPKQAIQVHRDIKSKQSIAMHFGCFPLADDGMGVAEGVLLEHLKEEGISEDLFVIPDEGVSLEFDVF